MLAPLSWLKEYVEITLKPDTLGERLSEVGLGVENITKANGDTIFEFEVTPNRPDLLSIVGIAREIAAIEGKKVRLDIKNIPKTKNKLPFTIYNDFTLLEHYTAVLISDVIIKGSPEWLRHRLVQIGLRPINNIVDITNYVMFELGIPLHAFDYDEIHGATFFVEKSKGREKLETVDKITYTLPKDAIIIRDKDRVVDLVGIKGGLNSGIKETTKTVLLQTSVDNPILIRRASQALSLRSDASNILEKGIDKNGLLPALSRAANLILEVSGGRIASTVFELKKHDYLPWNLKLRLERLSKMLGVEIPEKQVVSILSSLNLSPRKISKDLIEVLVPTYRNDLRIEEDLIEEVARIYGYNKFPKTMPSGRIPTHTIAYFKDYKVEEKVKDFMKACGFSEIYTYSLVSEKELVNVGINPQDVLRVDNPVSREYEYLRPTLTIALRKAVLLNKPNISDINLFELGKVYLGKSVNEAVEAYFLSGISNSKSYREVKGVLENLLSELGVSDDPSVFIKPVEDGIVFELNFSQLIEKVKRLKVYKPIPKYPPVIEDLAIVAPKTVKIGELIETIRAQSRLVVEVSILDQFGDTKTFHIVYQHPQSNLTTGEVAFLRKKILSSLQKKFNARLKE